MGVSLRGTVSLDEVERDIELPFLFHPLNLSLGTFTENASHYRAHDLWEQTAYDRPRLPLAPFETKREREIFGARILKTAVRFDFSEEHSLFDEKSAFAVEWRSGAVGFVFETETDFGFLARLKVEGQKRSSKDVYMTHVPIPQSPLDMRIETRVFLEFTYRH